MPTLTKPQKTFLDELFGERVTYDKTERKLYSHDIAAMPSMVKPVIGNTVPDAVVQPRSAEQLARLMRWADASAIMLTPRGKATSGYGGAIPVKNGLVVDFSFMKDVIAVDVAEGEVTVQPGISWEQLDRALRPHGLMLRLYPSSYPSSTVGGWLGQGGGGFGSYQYDFFADNVVGAKAALPGGEIRAFAGDDLELLAGAEGITGFVTEVTLKVMPLEDIVVFSIGCDASEGLQRIVEEVHAAHLPVWSMSFINPRMATLKNEAPVQMHMGHAVGAHVELPESYILTLACTAANAAAVEAGVEKILAAASGAERLGDEIARQEWEHRFKFMVVKRLGPSLVPSEVIVPLGELGAALSDVEAVIDHPIVKEGVIVGRGRGGKPEAVILGFIPADERKFNYNLVFGLALSVMKVAEQHGGRAYSTGLYFGGKADDVMGADVMKRIRAFKAQVDPKGILNPLKVTENGVTGTMMAFAGRMENQIRALGNRVTSNMGERPGDPVKGIPGDVAWYAYSCSQCGYCVDQCDQFYGRGWESQSPRGKWYWLREYMAGREKMTEEQVRTFVVCTTCELCNDRCSAALPIESSWMKLRGQLIQDQGHMTLPPFEMMSAALAGQGDIWAGYRKDRDAWFPEELLEKHGPRPQGRHAVLRRLHGELRGEGHRRGQRAPARRRRRGLHVPRRQGAVLRHADAGRRQMGPVRRRHEGQCRQRQGGRRRHGGHQLPRLQHDVAARVPGVVREARHRLRHHHQALQRGAEREDRLRRVRVPGAPGRRGEAEGHLARQLPHGARERCLRGAAQPDQGEPERRVRGAAVQSRGGALLRQRAHPDQRPGCGGAHRRR